MRFSIVIRIALLCVISPVSAQVGIGTTSPHSSAQLDINSDSKGLLTPRLTATQRAGISNPATGLLVYQTDGSSGFYYYNGSSWIDLPNTSNSSVPTGTVMSFAGSSAPTGWLLCDGSAINRTTYANLFTAIGSTYGSGNGSTTFNLPDLRGRTIFGVDNMGGTSANRLTTTGGVSANNTLGATCGAQSITLTTPNLPTHNHTFTGDQSTTSSNSHTHDYQDAYFAESLSGGVGANQRFGLSANSDNDNSFYFRTSSNTHSTSASNIATSSNSHSHTVTASGTVGNTGSGAAFSPLNPGIVMNYIIKI
jgi:microcystin-dependent protein